MSANAGPAIKIGDMARTSSAAGSTGKADAPRTKGVRRGDAIRELKKRDNYTNFVHIGLVYLVIIATIAGTIWSYGLVAEAGLGWWWNIPTTPRRDRCHRGVAAPVRRRHPRRHALHPVRQ